MRLGVFEGASVGFVSKKWTLVKAIWAVNSVSCRELNLRSFLEQRAHKVHIYTCMVMSVNPSHSSSV